MTFEELTAEERRLWAKVKEAKAAEQRAVDEWMPVHQQVSRLKAKEDLRQELLAELKVEKEAA